MLASSCGLGGKDLFGTPAGIAGGGGSGGGSSTSSSSSADGGGSSTTTSVTTTTGQGGASTTSGTGGAGGSTTDATTAVTTTTSGGGVDPIGCSDGTREYYVNVGDQPSIAGCAGGFHAQGVTTAVSMAPACGRIAGNDSVNAEGVNADGVNCTVEDLCSEGWHVCLGAGEVQTHSSTGECEPIEGDAPIFWLTRQVQDDQGNCTTNMGDTNNVTGCGTLGGPPQGSNCDPLTVRMRQQDCAPTANWFCGANQNDGLIEATIVSKYGSGEGGVLCCQAL